MMMFKSGRNAIQWGIAALAFSLGTMAGVTQAEERKITADQAAKLGVEAYSTAIRWSRWNSHAGS
jgi:hypothetical protein